LKVVGILKVASSIYLFAIWMKVSMVSSTVEDVFSNGFVSVNENETLSNCFSLFKEELPPVLIVLNSKDRYKGVLTRKSIIRSRFDPSITKVKTLMRSAPAISAKDSLSKVAKLMIESDVRELPVYRGEKLVGVITDEDIIHETVINEWGDTKVQEIMSKKPFIVEEDDSVAEVISLFKDQDISHAPVASKGKPTGMISIQDIIDSVYIPKESETFTDRRGGGENIKVMSAKVSGIMSRPLIAVSLDTNLRETAEKMHDFDISSLAVVSDDRIVGIVTKRDFLEPIAQNEPKGRLLIQFTIKDVYIDDTQEKMIMDDFKSFESRFEEKLKAGTLFVYLKSHGTNIKGDQLVHCRLHMRSRKGYFFSSSEGWGVEETFRLALDRLEREILKSKTFQADPEFAKTYLRRFPIVEDKRKF
jgi:CBS domain-containing protein